MTERREWSESSSGRCGFILLAFRPSDFHCGNPHARTCTHVHALSRHQTSCLEYQTLLHVRTSRNSTYLSIHESQMTQQHPVLTCHSHACQRARTLTCAHSHTKTRTNSASAPTRKSWRHAHTTKLKFIHGKTNTHTHVHMLSSADVSRCSNRLSLY